MANATWSLLRDPENQTRHGSEKPCWSRSLEGLGIKGRLGLEGLLLTLVSQLIVQWIDFHLEGRERFFTEFFDFLFDNTSRCYLCLYLSSLLLFISFLLLCCFKYGLEQLSCLYACVYTIPHLVLSQCKINQAITLIWGSIQLVCFRHISKLSIGIRAGAFFVV